MSLPPRERSRTSGCSITGQPSPAASSRARARRSPSETGSPSSENATAPAALMSASPASSRPALPAVTHPTGIRVASPHRAASPLSALTIEGESIGGSVLGMVATLVTPPATAALRPVSMVSARPSPGTLRCAWMSTRPGRSHMPDPSISAGPAAPRDAGALQAILPESTNTSLTASSPEAGSSTRAPLTIQLRDGLSLNSPFRRRRCRCPHPAPWKRHDRPWRLLSSARATSSSPPSQPPSRSPRSRCRSS